MPISRNNRRADIDFMFPIAILLILLVGISSTEGGALGAFGKNLKGTMGKFFGTTPQPCPFLQRGALSQVLMAEGQIVGSTNIKLCTDAACGSFDTGTITIRRTENGVIFDYTNSTGSIVCSDVRVDSMINNATMELFSSDSDTTSGSICGGNLFCDMTDGPCVCSQGDEGVETSEISDKPGRYHCTLRYYLATEVYGLNAKASRDAQFTQLAARPMPSYICIFIFGIMPFVVIYYLMQDLFAFVMLSQGTKKLLAIVMAAMAIVTGAFADLTYVITKLTNISLGYSFLLLIFGTGLAAVVVTNLMGLTSAASAMHRSLNEAHYGFMMLRSFGQQLESAAEKK